MTDKVYAQFRVQPFEKKDLPASDPDWMACYNKGAPVWTPVMEFEDATAMLVAVWNTGVHLHFRGKYHADDLDGHRRIVIAGDPPNAGYKLIRVRMLERGDFVLQEQGKLAGEIVRVKVCGQDHECEVDRLALEHGYVWLAGRGYRGYAEIKGSSCEYPNGENLPTATRAPAAG